MNVANVFEDREKTTLAYDTGCSSLLWSQPADCPSPTLGPRISTWSGSHLHAVPAGDRSTPPPELKEESQVPRLAPLEALLPLALERVERLELVVAGHQKQFDELVPLQRDILKMQTVMRGHHSAAFSLHSALQEAHNALCEEHEELCAALLSAGLFSKDSKDRPARRRRGTWPASHSREGQQVPLELTSAMDEPAAVECLRLALGPECWQQLTATSPRVLDSARKDTEQVPLLVAVNDFGQASRVVPSTLEADDTKYCFANCNEADVSAGLDASGVWHRLQDSPRSCRPDGASSETHPKQSGSGTPENSFSPKSAERLSRQRIGSGSSSLGALPPLPVPQPREQTPPPAPYDPQLA
eukprot:TRINITY_DN95985_c0_g1_i1.p1 TRINITY_DN95985_c0_g1~~TRINITY_DN95985_c0_g1_i1.p1  ORF type:complete len:392 (+),score=77.32 TRINITY_DN95985_c0_g1_i1:108-1178(+)